MAWKEFVIYPVHVTTRKFFGLMTRKLSVTESHRLAQFRGTFSRTVHVPMTFTVRGGRKTILSDAVPAPPQLRIDNALLKALARAHRWRRMIESGEYVSITELAKAEGVNQSYACRILRLSLLAPSLVTAILDGRHDSDVMLKQLMKPLPVRWDEQTAMLKLGDRS